MTELQGHEDRLEISADSGVFVRSRAEGSHGRSRVGSSAPALCQRAGCYQSHPWDLHMAPDLARAHARGVGRANDGAYWRSGDHGGLDPEIIERFEHGDVREPARAARGNRWQ